MLAAPTTGTTLPSSPGNRSTRAQWVSPNTAAKLNDTIKIKYKNYGGCESYEAEDIEVHHHTDVAYYRVGFLTDGLRYNTTSFRVRRAPASPGEKQLPWNVTYPGGLVASTSPGNSSVIDDQTGAVTSYVTWLRLGDEFMKILDVRPSDDHPNQPDAIVTVERGFWGSQAVFHPANTTAIAPIYHATGCHPLGGGSCLRYAFDPAQPYVAEYVSQAYRETFDGLWMDCFAAWPFRATNALGEDMSHFIYNVSGDVQYGQDGYVQAQRILVQGERATVGILADFRVFLIAMVIARGLPPLIAC